MTQNTLKLAAGLLLQLGFQPQLSDPDILEIRHFPWPVTATVTYDGGRLAWVVVRAHGARTRTTFPTKDPHDLPEAVARNVLSALLDLAILFRADVSFPAVSFQASAGTSSPR